jgi:hypothetical protein
MGVGCVGNDARSLRGTAILNFALFFQSNPASWRARAAMQGDKADNFTERHRKMTHRLGTRAV